jgi:hypothetical protein
MDNIEYSVDALNVRSAFYGAKTIIYVEGEDDVLFWEEIFRLVADQDFRVESLGGSEKIDGFIEKINAGELTAIVARDADFLPFLNGKCDDPKVLFTAGYSIENSLYVAETILAVARSWARSNNVTLAECEAWLNDLAVKIEPLVRLDLANAMASSGQATIGDNCTRFMQSQNSSNVCPNKILQYYSEIEPKLCKKAIKEAGKALKNENVLINHVRGHFLASAILKFIVSKAKSLRRQVSVSSDALYVSALSEFRRSIIGNHPHHQYYIKKARAAWQAI